MRWLLPSAPAFGPGSCSPDVPGRRTIHLLPLSERRGLSVVLRVLRHPPRRGGDRRYRRHLGEPYEPAGGHPGRCSARRPADDESISDGLERALSDTQLRTTLRERSLVRAQHYSWDAIAGTLMQTLTTLE